MAKGSRFYSPQLDGLRFCAAVVVLAHHAPAVPYLSHFQTYGWVGVDLFLSISSFLITRLIILEHQVTGSFSIRNFYIRRMLRIWPLYFSFATVACLAAILFGAVPAPVAAASWLSHLTFSNNLLTSVIGYSTVPYTAHLWTISLEEQAYLLLPVIMARALSHSISVSTAKKVAIVSLIILMLARAAFALAGMPHPFIWVLPLRADPIILGGLAAILVASDHLKPRLWMLPLGLLLVATAPLFPPLDVPGAYQIFGFLVTGCGCTAIVVGSQTRMMERSPLAWTPMRYLGKVSYGIYVFHAAVIGLTIWLVRLAGLPLWSVLPIALTLTVTVATLSYRILEMPFLAWKERFAKVASRPV